MIELLSAPMGQKSIEISTKLQPDIKVIADKEMISSVLRNLISNSIKFSNPGGKVIISAARKDLELIVEVEDSGVGIKPEILSGLFHEGERVSTRGTQNEEGTGLGLILCRELISKHHGKIWAESEVGKGSRFIFTLPLKTHL